MDHSSQRTDMSVLLGSQNFGAWSCLTNDRRPLSQHNTCVRSRVVAKRVAMHKRKESKSERERERCWTWSLVIDDYHIDGEHTSLPRPRVHSSPAIRRCLSSSKVHTYATPAVTKEKKEVSI